jgi:hypothetical protein
MTEKTQTKSRKIYEEIEFQDREFLSSVRNYLYRNGLHDCISENITGYFDSKHNFVGYLERDDRDFPGKTSWIFLLKKYSQCDKIKKDLTKLLEKN